MELLTDKKTRELLDTINANGGGFFKICRKGSIRPYMMGYAKSVEYGVWGDDWHRVRCVFFYNFEIKTLYTQEKRECTCGCRCEQTYAVKPSLEDYKTIEKLLLEKGLIFNKNKSSVEYDTRKRQGI